MLEMNRIVGDGTFGWYAGACHSLPSLSFIPTAGKCTKLLSILFITRVLFAFLHEKRCRSAGNKEVEQCFDGDW